MKDRHPRLDLDEAALEVAAFRHRIIAEAAEAEAGAITAAILDAAGQEYSTPGGRIYQPNPRTLWRWLHAFRDGGLLALCPRPRADRGELRAFEDKLLQRAVELRKEGKKHKRPTKSIIDILRRERDPALDPEPLTIARSTLDRHFAQLGVSRLQLHDLGGRPFTRIETFAPLELVVVDFHHGPYVRVGPHGEVARALLCAFIDSCGAPGYVG